MHLSSEGAMAKVSEDSRATWSVADEEALIAFLWTCQAEAGDGTNLKAATWTTAVGPSDGQGLVWPGSAGLGPLKCLGQALVLGLGLAWAWPGSGQGLQA